MSSSLGEREPFALKLMQLAAAKRQPASASIELTSRCNLKCNMCYIRTDLSQSNARANELPSEQWLDLARQAKEMGTVFVLLTGGEIFIRDDFFKIYEPLTRMGFVITIFTNGTLLTERKANILRECPPSRMEITLYGGTAATYEAVTGVPGSFSLCCIGIKNALAAGIPLVLKSTITKKNVDEIAVMQGMADQWGVPFKTSWLLTGRTDGPESSIQKCRLEPRRCLDLEQNEVVQRAWRRNAHAVKAAGGKRNFTCFAGRAAFHINPKGEMGICVDLPTPAIKPLESSFKQAWTQLQEIVSQNSRVSSDCSSCEALGFCQRCPAWSFIETGSLNAPVPYLCDLAWRRKQELGPIDI